MATRSKYSRQVTSVLVDMIVAGKLSKNKIEQLVVDAVLATDALNAGEVSVEVHLLRPLTNKDLAGGQG